MEVRNLARPRKPRDKSELIRHLRASSLMTSIQVLRSKEKKEEDAIENGRVNAGLMRGTMGTQGES